MFARERDKERDILDPRAYCNRRNNTHTQSYFHCTRMLKDGLRLLISP